MTTRFLWGLAAAALAALVMDRNPVDHGPEIVDALRGVPVAPWMLALPVLAALAWALRGGLPAAPRPARRVPRRRESGVAETARRRGMTRDAVRLARARKADPSARHESPARRPAPVAAPRRERGPAPAVGVFRTMLLPSARSLRKAEP